MYKIYSTKSCGYCERAKSLLAANGLPFEEVYVDESAENFDLKTLKLFTSFF